MDIQPIFAQTKTLLPMVLMPNVTEFRSTHFVTSWT